MRILALILMLVGTPALADGHSGFSGKFGLSYGMGSAENGDTAVPPRVLNSARAYIMPGWKIGKWTPGIFAEYRLTNQATDPSQVNNVNYKGAGYQAGVGVSYPWQRFEFAFAAKFFGEHALSNKVNGNPVIYRQPLGGFLGAAYEIAKFSQVALHAGFNFDFVVWNESVVNGGSNDIATNSVSDWGTALEIGARI